MTWSSTSISPISLAPSMNSRILRPGAHRPALDEPEELQESPPLVDASSAWRLGTPTASSGSCMPPAARSWPRHGSTKVEQWAGDRQAKVVSQAGEQHERHDGPASQRQVLHEVGLLVRALHGVLDLPEGMHEV